MLNDNEAVPNPALRAAVTDTAFSFTLRKTHLVVLGIIAQNNKHQPYSFWVPAANGLIRRGLVAHQYQPPFAQSRYPHPINDFFRLTKAGWLMHDLCVEAGLLDPVSVPVSKRKVA